MALKIGKNTKFARKEENLIFFDSDEDFVSFAILPYAKIDNDGKPYADYTDEYKEAVAEGKEFVIMKGSFDSFVNRNNVVTTRVLLPRELGSPHKDMLAQLPVENIATWY